MKNIILGVACWLLAFNAACQQPGTNPKHRALIDHRPSGDKRIAGPRPAADETQLYLSYLKGRNVGMMVNQTSIIGQNKAPLVDSLLKRGVKIKRIFGPEHGFRGNASDGADVNSEVDKKTGIPVVSLYGAKDKPTPADLKGLDLMIFDVQDVGTRFYTYISSLHYLMEACAENNIELMILDRPNPNGYLVDGGILDTAYRSFVGMHPIPASHGMTITEYAQMINGEKWLKNGIQCKLKLIKMVNYTHDMDYVLPISPSPNLNSQQSIMLYPHICWFEGTAVSLGRGTNIPFTVIGAPDLKGQYSFMFKPVSMPGMSDNPPQKNNECYGLDLRNYDVTQLKKSGKLNLEWLLTFYKNFPDKKKFFIAYFTRLAGNKTFQKQIEDGLTEAQIRQSWEPGLSKFRQVRKKYLLYN